MFRKNAEKYITFSVPINKEITKTDKDSNDKIVNISYKLQFIDSFRFMSTSLSSLIDNLSDGLHSNKCTDCKSTLDYMKVEDPQLIFKCLNCNEKCDKNFNKELINRFSSTYKFCNEDINKFIFLLRKKVYPYEYMDSWKRFDETSLPNKDFYSCLNMEDISDIDYIHAKRVFRELEMNSLGDYHDLYVQSDTLFLADIFGNFRNKCIETYELDPAYFLSAQGLTWQACLKKTEVELELLTDLNILLMFEEGIRGGITNHYIDMLKLIKNI